MPFYIYFYYLQEQQRPIYYKELGTRSSLYVGVKGSDVLKWRSFYANECNLWKAHYQEIFDHGIREALCCLGHVEYISSQEEDDIYSVAQLLGDLVTYRAIGAGHLHFLAGFALLQSCKHFLHHMMSHWRYLEDESKTLLYFINLLKLHIRTAATCFFSQILTHIPTTATSGMSIPSLVFQLASSCSLFQEADNEGDNWWRGHAAAFLRHVKLTPDALKKGCINQGSCKASYFIVVVHHLKSIVIAVRGTETPEDLITDGLGRERNLNIEHLDYLINGNNMLIGKSRKFVSSQTHYGHSGVVEASQDLYMQIEGNSKHGGFLSSLLGVGCECEVYNLQIVGHSLGGAIAAVLGFRMRPLYLYHAYPNLHVYAYGPLPCLDLNAANLCSKFVTSVVFNNEFSSRLSVASVMRLQASAVDALSQERLAGSTIVSKLMHNYLFYRDFTEKTETKERKLVSDGCEEGDVQSCLQEREKLDESDYNNSFSKSTFFYDNTSSTCSEDHYDPMFKFVDVVPTHQKRLSNIPEMFIPGTIIHVVPKDTSGQNPFRRRSSTWDHDFSYKAYIANRENFKDIIVAPSMFLDHLPWRRTESSTPEIVKQKEESSTPESNLLSIFFSGNQLPLQVDPLAMANHTRTVSFAKMVI
ncbi:OLC1v1001075C1 [Oldenlandia corymbosa var. corymbosa]|uniref:OLC1v1001075C1 n=1 Tax=Oldenlandia corymbosa var. corymbosa TaxID=529605 RepID=A0AAV1D4V0_OLDCO|nr:OLC1v1001075C1 [Oldenlandia corymbosa var. corymbosa]